MVDTQSVEFKAQNRRYWVMLAGLLAGIGLVVALFAWASRMSTSDYVSVYGGAPQVYAQIAGDLDCTRLQATFDRAWATHERAGYRYATGYMTAAERRMEQLGC